MQTETLEDIVREMREAIGVDASDWFTGKQVRDWAERIEAANKRKDESLSPVLAVPADALTGLWGVPLPDGGMMLTPEGVANAMRFIEAVRECKRIYNGETEDGE